MTLTDEDRAAIRDAAASIQPELVIATFGNAYLAGLRAGMERAAKVCEKRGQEVAQEHGYTEPDTGAFVVDSRYDDILETWDDAAAAIREQAKA